MEYGEPYHILTQSRFICYRKYRSIAGNRYCQSKTFESMLEKYSKTYHMLQYPDHHIFTIDDLKEIRKKFAAMESVE